MIFERRKGAQPKPLQINFGNIDRFAHSKYSQEKIYECPGARGKSTL